MIAGTFTVRCDRKGCDARDDLGFGNEAGAIYNAELLGWTPEPSVPGFWSCPACSKARDAALDAMAAESEGGGE